VARKAQERIPCRWVYIRWSEDGPTVESGDLARRVIVPTLKASDVQWHGWHAFRRGLATNLNRIGTPDKTIPGNSQAQQRGNNNEHLREERAGDSQVAMKNFEKAFAACEKNVRRGKKNSS